MPSSSSTREVVGVTPYLLATDVNSTTAYTGLYFTDTFAFTEQLLLTVAGRYNIATIDITDELGNKPGVDGTNTFQRFNPAVGLNYNPSKALNTYISYNQGMRAPTAIELTCANPSAPCPLPNAFLSDPPLQPVIAKTLELGGRGMLSRNTTWSAAVYRANLSNDIQFVSASASGAVGYFTNIPQTRRQGLELGVQQQLGAVKLQAAYALVDATYQSSFTVQSPNNSTANAAGDIQCSPATASPGSHATTSSCAQTGRRLRSSRSALRLVYSSSQYAQGDNNNQNSSGPVRRLYHRQPGRALPDHRSASGLRSHQQPVRPHVPDGWRSGREFLHRLELHLQPRRRNSLPVRLARRTLRHLGWRALRFRPTREVSAFAGCELRAASNSSSPVGHARERAGGRAARSSYRVAARRGEPALRVG